MFDEPGLMNSANGKFDFIKHLIPLFDENVWCISAGLKSRTYKMHNP